MIELRRGDVVLVAFPFVSQGEMRRKRRPAVIVQSDRYNRRRAAVILAAVTSTQVHGQMACKVAIAKDSPAGRQAGLRIDSVVDCQTLVTVPREEIAARLGNIPSDVMHRIDAALKDAIGLAGA